LSVPFCRTCGAEYPPGTPFCLKDGAPLASPTGTDAYAPTTEAGRLVPQQPAPPIEMGIAVGEYRVTDQIGQGGMGVVYGGVHPIIGKKVAIKVLRPEFASRSDVVARFVAEARAVNAIGSRHIVNIFSFGQLPDGRHYYVMDRLQGRPLTAYLRALKQRSLSALMPLLEDVLQGLAAAHAAKIVHRDLKPDNIFVIEEAGVRATAVLLDFGIAKLLAAPELPSAHTHTGAVLGTPYYMAPEQFRSAQVDARADLYAVGVILYEMFAGRVPFAADSYIDLVNLHLQAPPPRSPAFDKIPPRLERLIMRLLSKAPAERPQSAESVLEELHAIARGEPMTDERLLRSRPSAVRQWPWALLAAIMLGGGVFAISAARSRSDGGARAVEERTLPRQDEDLPGAGSAPAPGIAQAAPARVPPAAGAAPAGPAPGATPTADRSGRLIVHVKPPAQVLVDDQPAGSGAEVRKEGLAVGTHLIEARRAGYKPASARVAVEPGAAREISLELKPAGRARAGGHGGAGPDDDSGTLNPFQDKKR